MTAAIEAINKNAPENRAIIFVMYRFEIGPVVQSLRESFPSRIIIEYDQDRRPDVTHTEQTAIIVSTSALKTGTNLAETNLVLFYGCIYSLEDWLQGAGRGGRFPGAHVSALCRNYMTLYHESFLLRVKGISTLLCTPFSLRTALRVAGRDGGTASVKQIQEVQYVLRS